MTGENYIIRIFTICIPYQTLTQKDETGGHVARVGKWGKYLHAFGAET